MISARKMGGGSPKSMESEQFRRLQTEAVDAVLYNLLILSDIRFLREGLAEVLARDRAFHVAGAAAHLGEALAILRASPVQIILIDAALPDGLIAATQLRDLDYGAHIVPLALSETDSVVIAWAEAGATGYVPRSVGLDDLVMFLKEIVRGEQACSRRIASSLLRWVSRASHANGPLSPATPGSELTAREHQIAGLICAGLSNKEISRDLNIGLATTKSHVHNLLGKLELRRRGQLAHWSRGRDLDRCAAPINRVWTASPPSADRKTDTTPSQGRR